MALFILDTGEHVLKQTVKTSMKCHLISRSALFAKIKTIFRELSGRVLDSRPRGRRFEVHRHHCIVSLSKNINPSLVLVQPRNTRPFMTDGLLMGHKESNQTNNLQGQKYIINTKWTIPYLLYQYVWNNPSE